MQLIENTVAEGVEYKGYMIVGCGVGRLNGRQYEQHLIIRKWNPAMRMFHDKEFFPSPGQYFTSRSEARVAAIQAAMDIIDGRVAGCLPGDPR